MWTARDEQRTRGVNESLVLVMREAFARWHRQGKRVAITEGLRTRERQAELVRKGASRTMNSKHIVGKAVDVVILKANGEADWTPASYTAFARVVAQVALEMGVPIRWGGSWRWISGPDCHDYPYVGARFFDGPHFEV